MPEELTNFWTRDGHEWTVRGAPEEVFRAVNIIASNQTTKWVQFTAPDGRLVNLRKDFIAAIEGNERDDGK